ncbi:MAG: hypothetical protein LUQ13_01345 [Methanomicrobiales archaeon]|nr:hypothetical protein [Methanomicrobiales archaeon]
MGRSFGSVRMGVKDVTGRWLRAAKSLRAQDRCSAEQIADLGKRHASAGFCAFDDPVEAAIFSVCVELLKMLEEPDVDP